MSQPIRHGSAVIVDQNGFQQKLLRSLLRSSGFIRVTESDDIESGLDEAARSYPDFLFVDYDTAIQSDLLRGSQNIRENHLRANTNLIMLMQNPTRFRVDSAIASGAHWVISRPFSANILNLRIKALLEPDFGTPLKTPKRKFIPGPQEKPAKTIHTGTAGDISMTELVQQMDELMKQSRYFPKDGQNDRARQDQRTQHTLTDRGHAPATHAEQGQDESFVLL